MTKLVMYFKQFDKVDDITAMWQLAIDLVNIAIIVIIGYILMRIVIQVIRKILEKSRLDDASYKMILKMCRVLMWIIIAMVVLSYLKVDMSPFVAVLATGGAAIALAIKDSLSNVAGGIIMLFTKPFVKGDEVEVDGIEGIVDYIDIMNTTLHTRDNMTVIIPNGKIVTSVVRNYTDKNIRRIESVFSIGYAEDIDQAKEAIREVIRAHDMFLTSPEPVIGVNSHADSAIEIIVQVWVSTEDRYNGVYVLNEEVKKAFDRYDIEIPFPQIDIHYPEGRN